MPEHLWSRLRLFPRHPHSSGVVALHFDYKTSPVGGVIDCEPCCPRRRSALPQLRHLSPNTSPPPQAPGASSRSTLKGLTNYRWQGSCFSPDTSARFGVGYASAILPIRHLRLAFPASKDRHLKLARLSQCDPTFPSLLPPTEEDGIDVAVISPRYNADALH